MKTNQDIDAASVVKSREIQRAIEAEARGDRDAARRHFLAAAHLEAVLAEDYQNANLSDLAFRSRLSAASCFWRAGEQAVARQLFDRMAAEEPRRAAEVEQVRSELFQ